MLGWAFIILIAVTVLGFWTTKRKLKGNWDDIRYSIFSFFASTATSKLVHIKKNPRSWRPNILAIVDTELNDSQIIDLAHALNQSKGFLTYGTTLQDTEKLEITKTTFKEYFRMKVLIYGDEGVSPFSLQECLKTFRAISDQVEVVDHKFLKEKEWGKATKLLIFPGGRDIPYDQNLKGKGTAKIRKYVKEGGSFLGICAGAYFACDEVIFEKGTPLEVHEKRDLCFFPGAAIGTLYPHLPFSYEVDSGFYPSEVTFEGKELHLYYNGGCSFEDAEKYPNVTILARYLDASDKPAIIHCKVEKGNVILSGVHLEVNPVPLKKEGCDQMIIKKLKKSDSMRKSLISSILNKLL